jgi:hypothetical protein
LEEEGFIHCSCFSNQTFGALEFSSEKELKGGELGKSVRTGLSCWSWREQPVVQEGHSVSRLGGVVQPLPFFLPWQGPQDPLMGEKVGCIWSRGGCSRCRGRWGDTHRLLCNARDTWELRLASPIVRGCFEVKTVV